MFLCSLQLTGEITSLNAGEPRCSFLEAVRGCFCSEIMQGLLSIYIYVYMYIGNYYIDKLSVQQGCLSFFLEKLVPR